MSGANATAASGLQDQRGLEQDGHEPSMEEILASIRRIISDDQMLPLSPRASLPPLPPTHAPSGVHGRREAEPEAPRAARPQEPGAGRDHPVGEDEQSDVLDLADVAHHDDEPQPGLHHVAAPASSGDQGRPAEPEQPTTEDSRQSTAREPAGSSPAASIEHRPQAHSPESAPAAASPLEVPASEPTHEEPLVSHETMSSVSSHFHQLTATMLMQNFPPVDQIARELLRPMIKTWLDDNLPVMVERLVRAEIERVARVGR